MNIHFTNNIVTDIGNNGVYSTGGGAANNCWSAYGFGPYITAFATCWPGGSMTGNQLTSILPFPEVRLPWPTGNFLNTPNPAAGPNMNLINAAIANQH